MLSSTLKKNHAFATVQCHILQNGQYNFITNVIVQSNSVHTASFTDKTIHNCANFLNAFFKQITVAFQVEKINNNLGLIAEIEEKISSYGPNVANHQTSLESNQLKRLKTIEHYVSDYLSFFPIFLLVKKSNQLLTNLVLQNVLKIQMEEKNHKKPQFFTKKAN